jgi:uncharacterized protein YxjI
MPLLRRDHDADQTQYEVSEKMFSIGEDFWIENQAGERALKVDGKALRLRDTLILRDSSGNELIKGQKKAPRVEIAPGQDDALILAVAVCIDQTSHD